MKQLLFFIVIALISFFKINPIAFGYNVENFQYEYPNSIDIEVKECIDSTDVYNYPSCYEKAEKDWDNVIINNLSLLKRVMTVNEFRYIKSMNKDWLKSTNTETKAIKKFICNKEGIIYQTMAQKHLSDIKRTYALLLQSIYSNYRD